jgi:predicted lipoprotein with Yx(FWY)xxD motif
VIPHRIVLASVAGLASAFLLAACDSTTDTSGAAQAAPVTSAGPVTPAATTTPAPATTAPAAGNAVTITVRSADGVVTDGNGMTLYRYAKDEPNPSKWTCSGACVKTWLPVIVQDSVRTQGVRESLLGTVHRDGQKQLTLAGWPLYRYVGDTAAGQANGQGKDGQWHTLTASGAAG